MTDTLVFDALNVIASLIVFGIIAYKLFAHPEKFTWIERVGMGIMAAGCVMTIGPITFKPSPFDDWSPTLLRIGAAVYFIGRLTRHRLNNHRARQQAIKWRAER